MGDGTPLTLNGLLAKRVSVKGEGIRHSKRLGIDVHLLLIVITLLVFGLLMVYSASTDYSIMVLGREPMYMFKRQLVWLATGVMIAIFLAWMNYHRWQRYAIWGMGFTLFLLAVVLINNEVINNAARTLFGGSGQPSELAKLMTIIYLTVWMYAKRNQLNTVGLGLLPLGFILGIVGGIIMLQPDLSAATTIFILGGLLFFLAGSDMRQIVTLLVVGLMVGWFVFRVHPTGRIRVDQYLTGLNDLTQAPDHLSRALEALVKGGWFGVGIGRADTKFFGLGLPVPPTDSIFAVVVEETGIFGASVLVGLYIWLLWRGLLIAHRAPDGLGKIMAAGLSLWIAMEAFINMAVLVGLVPFAGNALPFISAGGSSLVVSLMAVGILLSISRLSTQGKKKEERVLDAVVDLRRWDRRRRISRSRRVTGTTGRKRKSRARTR